MATWGTTSVEGTKGRIRRRLDAATPQGPTIAEFFRPSILSWYYTARHAVDDSNNTRQGTTSIEDVWATKDWRCRAFGFFFGVIEANVRNAYNYIHRHEGEDKSLADIRKELTAALINNPYIPQGEEAGSPPRKTPRGAELTSCAMVAMAPKSAFRNGRIVPNVVASNHPQRHCMSCHSRTVYYCACTPARAVCADCFATHVARKAREGPY